MTIQMGVLYLRDKINNQLFNKQYLDYCHPQLRRADTAFKCLGLHNNLFPTHTMSCKMLKSTDSVPGFYFYLKTVSSACGRRKQCKKSRKSPQKCKLTNTVTALIPKCAQAEHTLFTAGTVPFPRAALTQLLESTDTHYTAAIPDVK